MLSKQYRLSRDKDFQRVYRQGKNYFAGFLGIKVVENSLTESRFGIVVSKKTARRIVDRNKTKRRIRAIIKNELMKIKPGFDIVVLTKPLIQERDFQEIEAAIQYVLDKARIYQ